MSAVSTGGGGGGGAATTTTPATTTPATATPAVPGTSLPVATASPGTATPGTAIPATSPPPGSLAPGITPSPGTTNPAASNQPTTPARICTISLAVADVDRNNLLSETEYITFLNRIAANKYISITAFASLPQSLQTNYNTLVTASGSAPGSGLPITGASPAQQADAAQQALLDQICSGTDTAIFNANNPTTTTGTPATIGPSTVTPSTPSTAQPGTITPSTVQPGTTSLPGSGTNAPVNPDFPRSDVAICKISMAAADRDRNSLLSSTEYPIVINQLASNKWAGVTTLAGLPQALQDNFNSLAAGNEIDIFGASPAQQATEAQSLALEKMCESVDLAIYLANGGTVGGSGEATTPPVDTLPPSSGNATGGSLTPTPATVLPASSLRPTQDPSLCKTLMAGADESRDSLLNMEEYVVFLNFVSTNQFAGQVFAALPSPLTANFNAFVNATSGQIPIEGASPVQAAQASPEQVAFLDNFCLQTSYALQDAAQTVSPTEQPGNATASMSPTNSSDITPGPSTTSAPGNGGNRTDVNTTAMPSSGTVAPTPPPALPPIDASLPFLSIHSSFRFSTSTGVTAQELSTVTNPYRHAIEVSYQQFIQNVVPRLLAGDVSLPITLPPFETNTTNPATVAPTLLPSTGIASPAPNVTAEPPVPTPNVTVETNVTTTNGTQSLPPVTLPSNATTAPILPGVATTAPVLPGAVTTAPVLPGAASTTPVLPDVATAAPVLPGEATTAPILPGAATTAPVLPGGATAAPELPSAATTAPMLPGAATTAPLLPGTTTMAPVLPGAATTAPALPGAATTAPFLPGIASTQPALPDSTTMAPGLPGTATTAPVRYLRGVRKAQELGTTTSPALPGVATTPPVLPSAATTTPVLPGAVTTQPVLPGVATMSPVLPGANTTQPVVPDAATTQPVLPVTPTTVPVLPGVSTTAPALPGVATTAPLLPGAVTTAPVLPGAATTQPVLPGTVTTTPVLPGAATTAPVLPGMVTTTPVLPDIATTAPVLPADTSTLTPDLPANASTTAPVSPDTPNSTTIAPSIETQAPLPGVSLKEGARLLRFEDAVCEEGITNANCFIAFAVYSVTVADGVDRESVYNTLVTRTQEAIENGLLQEALNQFDPASNITINGASFPPYVAIDIPTPAPTLSSPTDAPSEEESTILGLSLGAFIGIVSALVIVTCLACGCFAYVILNLKSGDNSTKNVSTKDASDGPDDFDDDHEHEPQLNSENKFGSTPGNSFGFQVQPGPSSGFFNNGGDNSSSGSEEETPGGAARADFGYEIGGPGEFTVEIEDDDSDGTSDDSLKGAKATGGFQNGDNFDSNDFGNNFTSDQDTFFGGGDAAGWGQTTDLPSSNQDDGFGFQTEASEESGSEGFEEEDEAAEESLFDEEESESEDDSYNLDREMYREQIEELVRVAAPHELDNIDMMMQQFRGREEELVQTLQTMHSKKKAGRNAEAEEVRALISF